MFSMWPELVINYVHVQVQVCGNSIVLHHFYLLFRIGRKWIHGGFLLVGSSGCLAWTVLHLLSEF